MRELASISLETLQNRTYVRSVLHVWILRETSGLTNINCATSHSIHLSTTLQFLLVVEYYWCFSCRVIGVESGRNTRLCQMDASVSELEARVNHFVS